MNCASGRAMGWKNLHQRIPRYLGWRFWEIQTFLSNRLNRHRGWLSRFIRYPFGFNAPFQKPVLHLRREAGIGDVLLTTPSLRLIREKNPSCTIKIYTNHPELISGLGIVDEVLLPSHAMPDETIFLYYEDIHRPTRHLARIIGDKLGLNVKDVRPSCMVNDHHRQEALSRLSLLPKPWITVSRYSSDYTPNKQWPEEYWDSLVASLLSWATVIELGIDPAKPSHFQNHQNYLDLQGTLTVEQFVAAIHVADLNLCTDSGPNHVAAAFGVPSVVIYGGYISPSCTDYPGNINLGSNLPCSNCRLRTPCPIDRKCLREILPENVEESLRKLAGVAKTKPFSLPMA